MQASTSPPRSGAGFIDKRGPQTALIVAAVLVPIGYSGLSLSYSGDWSLHSTGMLFFLNLLTGWATAVASQRR